MPFDINSVVIVGRLTRDVELSYTPSTNMAISKFGLAHNSSSKEGDAGVSFFDIVAFGKTAENCNKYINKGSQVVINGRIQQSRWQDKNDGSNRSRIEIVASNVQFVGARPESAGGNFNEGSAPMASSDKHSSRAVNPPVAADHFDTADFSDSDEDIPF